MKKLFAIVLTAAILMCMSAGFALAEGYVYITGDTNVRTGPGLGYSKLATLNKGSTVPFMQQTAYDSRGVAWYRVTVGTNNAVGWVVSSYAYLTNYSGYATYADGANAGGGTQDRFGFWDVNMVTVNGDVNVRSGPGVQHSIVNTMFEDEQAVYLGDISYDDRGVMWYHVSFEDTVGWVSSVYAELEYDGTAWFNWVKIVNGNCNVRTGPGLGYKSIGTAYEEESLSYLGHSSIDERGVTWYHVAFNNTDGWVSATYSELS